MCVYTDSSETRLYSWIQLLKRKFSVKIIILLLKIYVKFVKTHIIRLIHILFFVAL